MRSMIGREPALGFRVVTSTVGVFALQGDVREHLRVLDQLGAPHPRRTPAVRARAVRRARAPGRGVDDDGEAGPDLRALRAAP